MLRLLLLIIKEIFFDKYKIQNTSNVSRNIIRNTKTELFFYLCETDEIWNESQN